MKTINDLRHYNTHPTPMSKVATQLMMSALLTKDDAFENHIKELILDDVKTNTLSLIHLVGKRAMALGLWDKVSPSIFALIEVLSETPGECALYLHTLHVLTKDRTTPYTMSELANDFPMGFPSREALSEAWSAQKDKGNVVDHPSTYGLTEFYDPQEIAA